MNLDKNGIAASPTRPLNLVLEFAPSVERSDCLLMMGTHLVFYLRE